MPTITLPTKLNFKQWVYCLNDDLPLVSVPLPSDEKDWEKWVETLIYNNATLDIPLPKIEFNSTDEPWKRWAEYFVVSAENF